VAGRKLEIDLVVAEDTKGIGATIQQIEVLEDRVKLLTKDTVELRKAKQALETQLVPLNQRLADGAVLSQEEGRQLVQLRLREAELANSMERTAFSARTARQELRNLNFAANDATRDAQLLAAQFGVNLPAGIAKFATRLPGVQEQISKVFQVAAVAAFASGIVALALPALQSMWDRLTAIDERIQNTIRLIQDANARALAPETPSGFDDRAAEIRRQIISKEKEKTDTEEAVRRRRQLLSSIPGVGPLIDLTAGGKLEGESAKIEAINKRLQELDAELIKTVEGGQKLRQTLNAIGDRPEGSEGGDGRSAGEIVNASHAALERIKFDSYEAMRALDDFAGRSTEQNVKNFEAAAKLYDEDYKEWKRIQEMKLDLDTQIAEARLMRLAQENEEAARLADKQVEMAKRAAEEQQRHIQETAREWESMYDRIIGSAHNAGDVLKNIWAEMKNAWKRQVFEMLAAWALGQRQMTAGPSTALGTGSASGGGIGGALRGILGPLAGIFGGGATGGGGAGGTFGSGANPNNPAVFSLAGSAAGAESLANVGFHGLGGGTGIGYGATAVNPPATQAAGLGLPANTPLGDLLSKLGLKKFGPMQMAGVMGGLSIADLGFGKGSLLGGLGGFAGGALAGAAIGSIIPGVGTLIGGIVGGIIGGLRGLLGGDKNKEHDAQIENQGFAAIKQLLEEYSHHRIDYASTFEGYQEVHRQMQAAFVRKESKANEQFWFDKYVAQLQGIEDERNRRRLNQQGLAIPEFEQGGFVGGPARTMQFADGGAVPALLHAGEFVLNRKATERYGTRLLEGMNSGPGPGGGDAAGFTMQIWTPDKNFAAKIVAEGIPVVIGRGGKASAILRGA
jgi:hypothetical protein